MATQTIEVLIEGGKATAAPPLGPALGPMGVNIGQVVSEINKKTESFRGMQVPVKVQIDSETKGISISVGTPPSSQLIKKEAGIEKGSGKPNTEKVADILIEQIIKVAKMKESALLGKTPKDRVKEIIGTCNSMGILVEGKPAVETIQDVDAGKFDKEIASGKTELTAEEKAKVEAERKRMQEEIEKRRTEFTKAAETIIKETAGKTNAEIKAKLKAAGIPDEIIKASMPTEVGAAAGEKKPETAAPAAAKAAPAKEPSKK